MAWILNDQSIYNFLIMCYNIIMSEPKFLRLSTGRDALVASSATFVLTSIFFVMAFILYPAIR